MSLSSVTSSCPVMQAHLSRGGGLLYAQRQRFHDTRGQLRVLNSVLVKESFGPVVKLCNKHVEQFINSSLYLAEQFREGHNLTGRSNLTVESLGGVEAIGIVSIRTLAERDNVVLEFWPRFDGGGIVLAGTIPASAGILGKITELKQLSPTTRPHTRRPLH